MDYNEFSADYDIERILEMAQSGQYEVCIFGAGYLGKHLGRETLSIYNIHADYYCDNNRELWGKEIIDNLYCRAPEQLADNAKNVICFIFVSVFHTEIVTDQLKTLGVRYIIPGLDISELEQARMHFLPFLARKKTVVYTCITGGYDDLKEPEYISDDCDYYLVSDEKPDNNSIYQYLDIKDYLPDQELDNSKKNRYVKLLPHLIFPQYRYSIYIDGSIILKGNLCDFTSKMPESRLITLSRMHMNRYTEAIRLMNDGMAESDVLYKQMEKYYLEGLPGDFGNWLNTVLIREHNHPNCIKLMEDWWQEMMTGCRRDQVSLPYVLWKNGYRAEDVGVISENPKPLHMLDSPYLGFVKEHNVDRKIEGLMKKD